MSDIEIDYSVFTNVADGVEEIAEDISTQARACTELLLDSSAFGLMFSWAVIPFGTATGLISNGLNQISTTLDDAASQLRAASEDFYNADDQLSQDFDNVAKQLGTE